MEKMNPIAFEGCKESGGSLQRLRLIRLSSLLCLLTIMVMWSCMVSKPGEIQEIMGTWETSAPGYEDCSFEITRSRVVFKSPSTKPGVNVIREIVRSSEGKCALYEITYEDEQKLDYTLSIHYCRAGSDEIIFFKNQQKIIWKRKFVPDQPTFSSNDLRVSSMVKAAYCRREPGKWMFVRASTDTPSLGGSPFSG